MSTYQFIYLHPHKPDDDEKLITLKNEFNELASRYNTQWPSLSVEEKEEMIAALALLEWEILNYMSQNRPQSKE
ncbi:hypothetical protein GXP67_01945 [Rhodocytophaga rosea]|uniref:Uncharacterized protein n=1 Tax=Rhodocytophaga rosea TaxID=2704465 RepID=A0A6C0GC46_9BACT|nr:hypothetical protein [Rhodocytophaga rosea]QHT65516.1 hypothetical protein GXP67_01945 [Rhodocytophaga rosea]